MLMPEHPAAGGSAPPGGQTTAPAKTLGRRIRRAAVWTVGIVAVLLIAGVVYQAIATAIDERRYPPPGELVDVGGYRLHYRDMGDGDVPVILEAGGGSWSLHWSRVQPEAARFARVIAYDRAGCGWSDAGPAPRTSHRVAEELHDMLRAAGVPGPYVLVGHSAGGYHVRTFAHLYPEEVAGLVLVDPSNEERVANLPEAVRQEIMAGSLRQGRWRSALARVGIVRLYMLVAPPQRVLAENAKLPEEEQPKELALGQLPDRLMGNALEGVGDVESAGQVAALGGLGDLPLVLLTAEREGLSTPPMRQRMEMHARQARLSTRGRHVTVPDSGHMIPLDQPQAVVDAVREVLAQARQAKR
jgi:pimeloyl-ACP methyl ester carboxylesterase